MEISVLVKAFGIWFGIVILAIVNAGIREKLLAPAIGPAAALPASGLLLSVIILAVAYFTMPLIGSSDSRIYISIGVFWLVLTLAFEFLFGHYGAGKPWREVLQVFDVRKGDLFVVALLATLVAPWIMARLRGLIE
ncbi:MAG: hypothetical protein IPM66_11750 [Acidobacteriota bacterium]|nr:MAG: hypothetical protein IPM66_11750 [Acidobacteriota bacterium]